MNELGQIVLSINTTSTSFYDDAATSALGAYAVLHTGIDGKTLVELVYLDKPSFDGDAVWQALEAKEHGVGKVNATGKRAGFYTTQGEIVVVDTEAACVLACAAIAEQCKETKLVCWDVENKVTKKAGGTSKKAATLQIAASMGHTYLFQLTKLQVWPPQLAAIFNNPSIKKVAHFHGTDKAKMVARYPTFTVNGDVCSSKLLAKEIQPKPAGGCGLASYALHCLNVALKKGVDHSIWENKTLTPQELDYATSDSQVLLLLMRHIGEGCSGGDGGGGGSSKQGDGHGGEDGDVRRKGGEGGEGSEGSEGDDRSEGDDSDEPIVVEGVPGVGKDVELDHDKYDAALIRIRDARHRVDHRGEDVLFEGSLGRKDWLDGAFMGTAITVDVFAQIGFRPTVLVQARPQEHAGKGGGVDAWYMFYSTLPGSTDNIHLTASDAHDFVRENDADLNFYGVSRCHYSVLPEKKTARRGRVDTHEMHESGVAKTLLEAWLGAVPFPDNLRAPVHGVHFRRGPRGLPEKTSTDGDCYIHSVHPKSMFVISGIWRVSVAEAHDIRGLIATTMGDAIFAERLWASGILGDYNHHVRAPKSGSSKRRKVRGAGDVEEVGSGGGGIVDEEEGKDAVSTQRNTPPPWPRRRPPRRRGGGKSRGSLSKKEKKRKKAGDKAANKVANDAKSRAGQLRAAAETSQQLPPPQQQQQQNVQTSCSSKDADKSVEAATSMDVVEEDAEAVPSVAVVPALAAVSPRKRKGGTSADPAAKEAANSTDSNSALHAPSVKPAVKAGGVRRGVTRRGGSSSLAVSSASGGTNRTPFSRAILDALGLGHDDAALFDTDGDSLVQETEDEEAENGVNGGTESGTRMFEAAAKSIVQYIKTKRDDQLELPAGLSGQQRHELHGLCDALNTDKSLFHYSAGIGADRRFVLERRSTFKPMSGANGEATVGYLVAKEGRATRGRTSTVMAVRGEVVEFNADRFEWSIAYTDKSHAVLGEKAFNTQLRRRWDTDFGTDSELKSTLLGKGPIVGAAMLDKDLTTYIAGIDTQWAVRERKSKVKYDVRHWLANFCSMSSSPKTSEMYKVFVVAVSDALFKILPGERARVVQHLVALGVSKNRIRRIRRRYWRTRCKYSCPDPETIIRGLFDVCKLRRESRFSGFYSLPSLLTHIHHVHTYTHTHTYLNTISTAISPKPVFPPQITSSKTFPTPRVRLKSSSRPTTPPCSSRRSNTYRPATYLIHRG